ncbi:MAG TPA: V-type ATP synthase subunit D [Candidatus Limnocylindrales bacterium]|nr:V-type ATP synthase subunit D [Candidatus Limnocylindrales bacterium]
MKLHHPPGRSGRLWLEHRLAVATRGHELLEEKRHALAAEERRLRVLAEETRARWTSCSLEAERWLVRAVVLAGEHQVALLATQVERRASAELSWRGWMGVSYPAEARADLPPPPPAFPVGGTAAMDLAVRAVGPAVEAAVEHAAAAAALERVTEELLMTIRRVRVIERRWIPTVEATLHDLRLRLDEAEREDAVRARWVQRRITAREAKR